MRVRIPSEIPIWPKKSRKELKTPAPFHEKENGAALSSNPILPSVSFIRPAMAGSKK
jgi:hypothetical protein